MHGRCGWEVNPRCPDGECRSDWQQIEHVNGCTESARELFVAGGMQWWCGEGSTPGMMPSASQANIEMRLAEGNNEGSWNGVVWGIGIMWVRCWRLSTKNVADAWWWSGQSV